METAVVKERSISALGRILKKILGGIAAFFKSIYGNPKSAIGFSIIVLFMIVAIAVSAGAKFCPECGESLAAKCPKCGKDVKPGIKFCPECGAKIK